MASIRSYKNGAGGSSGADLAALEPTQQSGNYWYVGNAVPGASDANAGSERTKPLLTTAQALTNAAAGDTVVWLASHNESISVSVNIAKAGTSWVGEGTGSAIPRLNCTGAITMLDVTAAGVLIDNVYFPASSAAAGSRVRVGAASTLLNALQFDCGTNDTNRALQLITNGNTCRLTNSRFTAVGSTPAIGIEITNTVSDLTMDTVTFDGGSFQWSDYALKGVGAPTRFRMTRVYQFNGSHILLPTGSTGTLNVLAATGDSRVDWTV